MTLEQILAAIEEARAQRENAELRLADAQARFADTRGNNPQEYDRARAEISSLHEDIRGHSRRIQDLERAEQEARENGTADPDHPEPHGFLAFLGGIRQSGSLINIVGNGNNILFPSHEIVETPTSNPPPPPAEPARVEHHHYHWYNRWWNDATLWFGLSPLWGLLAIAASIIIGAVILAIFLRPINPNSGCEVWTGKIPATTVQGTLIRSNCAVSVNKGDTILAPEDLRIDGIEQHRDNPDAPFVVKINKGLDASTADYMYVIRGDAQDELCRTMQQCTRRDSPNIP